MNIAKNISFAISAAFFLTAATIAQLIANGTKGVLTFLINTFGIDAGMDIACHGFEYAMTASIVTFAIGIIITAIKK